MTVPKTKCVFVLNGRPLPADIRIVNAAYNPDQERDDNGRWGSGGPGGGTKDDWSGHFSDPAPAGPKGSKLTPGDKAHAAVRETMAKVKAGEKLAPEHIAQLGKDLGKMRIADLRQISAEHDVFGIASTAGKKADLVKEVHAQLSERAAEVGAKTATAEKSRVAAEAKPAAQAERVQQVKEAIKDTTPTAAADKIAATISQTKPETEDGKSFGDGVAAASKVFEGGCDKLIERYGVVAAAPIAAAAMVAKVIGATIGAVGAGALVSPAFTPFNMAVFPGMASGAAELVGAAAGGLGRILGGAAAIPLVGLAHAYEALRGKRLNAAGVTDLQAADAADNTFNRDDLIRLGVEWLAEMEAQVVEDLAAQGLYRPSDEYLNERADATASLLAIATDAALPTEVNAVAWLNLQASAEEPKRFSMLAYSGGPLALEGYDAPVYVDLKGISVKSQAIPAIRNHKVERQIGHTDKIAIGADQISMEGVISAEGADARDVIVMAQRGYPWQASIGARAEQMEVLQAGQSSEVNNRLVRGPCYVARKSVLREISFVAVGADAFTSVQIAASHASLGKDSNMDFETWIKGMGLNAATLSATQKVELKAAYDAKVKATVITAPVITAPGAAGGAVTLEAVAGLLKTHSDVTEIRAMCGSDHADVFGEAVKDGQIQAGWTPARVKDQIELKTLRANRNAGPYVITGHGHDRDVTIQAMQGAMILRSGGTLDSKAYQTQEAVAMELPAWLRAGINNDQRQRIMEVAHGYAQMSAVDVCREACRLDGRGIPANRTNMIRAAFSGSALSSIFTTNVNARMVAVYLEAPDTTKVWTQETEVNDFRPNEEIQLAKGQRLRKLPRGKTADHASFADRSETYQAARYAEQFQLDEQDIIDDRLNAFMEVVPEMGLAAARLRPDLVYAILLGNPTLDATLRVLFNTTDGNLATGSALNAANLKAAISAMRLVQDNGVNLNITPTHLIVPASLEWTAAELLQSAAIVIAGTAGSVTERGTKNVLEGALSPVADARLENGVTDPDTETVYSGSASTWYLASTQGRTIKVAYLAGTGRAPQVRNFALSEGKWGMGWDIKHDIGAAAMDWRFLRRSDA